MVRNNEAEGYRWLVQNGVLPVWLEESDPAGVIFYCLPFPYRIGCPDWSYTQLRADGISN
jgi:hypothetical protein